MRISMQKATALALALFVTVLASPASAVCTRLGFTVNDYGKEGPTRDAKNLLDKYIAKWAGENGIKGYKTGPKSVKCELFLDFGVFDEHTCRAEASVCWDGPAVPGMPSAKPQDANADGAAPPPVEKPKAAAKATTPENNASRTETGSTTKAEPAVEAAKASDAPTADMDAAKAAARDAAKDGTAPPASTGSTNSQ